MDFKSLNLSDFVRYILSGFNFILFVVVLPLAYIQPSTMKDLLSESSFLIIAMLSIAVGYMLDILRVYQLTPKFIKNRTEFMKAIAETLDIPHEQASNYFSLTVKLWKKYSAFDLERQQSEWVLSLQTGVILIFSFLIWVGISLITYFQQGVSLKLILPSGATVLSLVLGIRLFRVADGMRKKANRDYILILKKNKTKILNGWKMEDKEITQ